MTQRVKRIERIKSNQSCVRFAQLQWLLFSEGFIRYRQRGSHITFHHKDGRILFVPKPHGHKGYCHPSVVRRVLKELDV